jgi:DNA (cytosine-5)-methyltransferase 1
VRAYYNEFDKHAAAWLRELIKQKLIADGDVDERSICDVQPDDLKDYAQCHFFAGIGGWSYALRLAGVPDELPVWTGSCPCQPFSAAGKQLGTADERHLWPVFFRLIAQCRPELVFGEQVAIAIGKGWLDGVSTDLDSEGYACGAAVLGAHSIGAPHIRQRLFWMAHPVSERGCSGHSQRRHAEDAFPSVTPDWQRSEWVHCRDGKQRRSPLESSLRPLAHGVSGRVGLLRGYGNAIVPQVASEFIQAALEVIE